MTFITEQLVHQLNLPRQALSLVINGIGGSRSTQTLGLAQLTLYSRHSQDAVTIEAHILRAVTSIIPSSKVTIINWPHLQNLTLADGAYYQPRLVDIIVGAGYYGPSITPRLIKAHPGSPVAQSSIFGWLILGHINSTYITTVAAHHGTIQRDATGRHIVRIPLKQTP